MITRSPLESRRHVCSYCGAFIYALPDDGSMDGMYEPDLKISDEDRECYANLIGRAVYNHLIKSVSCLAE